MVWRRNDVSIALVLCLIVVGLIGSHGEPFKLDEKEVRVDQELTH
jgi:hypothetical protein